MFVKFRLCVLLSGKHGHGSNMQRLAEACSTGYIPDAEVALVVATHRESPALIRARDLGLNVTVLNVGDADSDLLQALDEAQTDLICLAGYLRKIPEPVLRKYHARIMNIHPALLPAFGGKGMYGRNVHEAVIAYGAKVSGCTVHFVDEDYDSGPIILQRVVDVCDDDTPSTLAQRVLAQEHIAYKEAVRLYAQGRISLDGRHVRIAAEPASKSTVGPPSQTRISSLH